VAIMLEQTNGTGSNNTYIGNDADCTDSS